MDCDHGNLIKKMTDGVIEQVEKDIEKDALSISPHSTDIGQIIQKAKHRKNQTHQSTKIARYDIDSLGEMKQSKMFEIREIERHESILKRSTMLNTSNVSRSVSKLEQSRFTEEQMRVIKDVMKKQKQFAKTLREKQQKLVEWIEEKRVEDQELRKKEVSEKCELRKQELKEKREELEKKKEERKLRMEEEIKTLKELKAKRLLHQEMMEKAKEYLSKQEQKQYEKYLLLKEQKKLAVADIEAHEKLYLQRKRQHEQKRSKMLEQSRSFSKSELPSIHSNIWSKVKHHQEQELKILQYERNLKQDYISKQKVYSKNVKQLFLPKLTNRTNQLVIKEDTLNRKKPLGLEEEHIVGNNYMKNVHENINADLKEKARIQSKGKEVEEIGGYSAFYKNYLKDLKEGHKCIQAKDLKSSAFEQLLANPNESEEVKFKKAMKMLLAKDRQPNKHKDSEIVDSIKSKLVVLKQMMR